MNEFKILTKKTLLGHVDPKILKKSAIIAHLYYEDKFRKNFEYLKKLDKRIDIYIITSNPLLEKKAINTIKKLKLHNVKLIRKNNRGRDFAALLISSKDIVKRYEYICFVHDKKNRIFYSKEFGDNWEKGLFDYTICNDIYVKNIINFFETNKDVGLLSAPMVPEDSLLELRGYTWCGCLEDGKKLLKKLNIKQTITKDEDPITIGDAFWFRRRALNRLFTMNFKYEDFPEEPMPRDFTIAHLLERIIDIVVKNEGYKSYYVMSDEDAEKYLNINDSNLTKTMIILRNIHALRYKNNKLNLNESINKSKNINEPKTLFEYCERYGIEFIITDNNEDIKAKKCLNLLKKKKIDCSGIYQMNSADKKEIISINNGIIICSKRPKKIIKELLKMGRKDVFVYKQ